MPHKPSPVVIGAILGYLSSQHDTQRPPEKCAAILATLADLQERGEPAPTREELAKMADCSKFTVDACLSTRIAQGHVKLEIRTRPGNVQRRESIIKERFYILSNPLMDRIKEAKKQYATIQLIIHEDPNATLKAIHKKICNSDPESQLFRKLLQLGAEIVKEHPEL